MRRFAFAFATLVLVALCTSPLAAQAARQKGSLWLQGGAGVGSIRLTCDLCTDERDWGYLGRVAGGVVATQGLRLGVEVDGFFDQEGNTRRRTFLIGTTALWQPSPASGFFLRGGLGQLRYRAYNSAQEDPPVTRTRPISVTLGVGYDWFIGGSSALTPQVALAVGFKDDLIDGNNVITSVGATFITAGLSYSWR